MGNMLFEYDSTIKQITELNSSFDACTLRVCYAGLNRNHSILPKEVIEAAIPSMSYCPIVANYNVDEDTIGGHDVDIIKKEDGSLKMVNLTDAVGVVPDNPNWYWENIEEDDGTVREYLCVDAIIWKRASVYDKLKSDGVVGHSMEISVKDGKRVDGGYQVNKFEFNAFCLLGDDVEPCFESSSMIMFSDDILKTRIYNMVEEFEHAFSDVSTENSDDINDSPDGEKISLKGGEEPLDMNENINEMTGVDEENNKINNEFALNDQAGANDNIGDEHNEEFNDQNDEQHSKECMNDGTNEGAEAYSLTVNHIMHELNSALNEVTVKDKWGDEYPRYSYYDHDDNEVYVMDRTDWNVYGLTYSFNGDAVSVDFASCKRKKIQFVDFDFGDMEFDYSGVCAKEIERISELQSEINELREYKINKEKSEADAARKAQLDELFNKFSDISDDPKFVELSANCADMDIMDIEDKCYAIRGRNVGMKFAHDMADKPVRLPVEQVNTIDEDEPYGGLFVKYGVGNHK